MSDQTNGQAEPEITNTQTLTIQGITFVAPAPYAEGHTLNGAEASALNQLFGENLRNNFSAVIKSAKDKLGDRAFSEAEIEDLRSRFNAYSDEYEFQGRRQRAAQADPVMREAKKLARVKLDEALRARGSDKKEIENYEALVMQIVENTPAIREEAARRVEASKALADMAMSQIENLIAG